MKRMEEGNGGCVEMGVLNDWCEVLNAKPFCAAFFTMLPTNEKQCSAHVAEAD
jgi:hypothetical protein